MSIVFTMKDYVLAVAKTGNFSRAAENLYISQPSLSASIRRLENQIGTPLFDRSTHPVRLTSCGEAYLRSAIAIRTAEERFSDFLEDYGSCRTGSLTLGGSNMNIAFTLPKLIKQFRKAYPNIIVSVEEGNINELKSMVLEGKLDLIVDSGNADETLFSVHPYIPENLVLSVPGDFACNEQITEYVMRREDILADRHLSSEQPELPLKKVKDVPFVCTTPETDTYRRSMQLCQRAGFSPNITLSFHQQATVFHTNNAGMGAAFISDMQVKNGYPDPNMRYYKIGGSESFRHISFYRKRGKRMTPAMQAFLQIVEKEKDEM